MIGSAAGIARSVIPRVSPPVCCVQYACRNSNIASKLLAFHDCTQQTRTVPVGLALFRADLPGIGWGEVMASALTAGAPAIIVFLLLQRQFISGLTEGAVKG